MQEQQELIYGMPSYEAKKESEQPCFLDEMFTELTQEKIPNPYGDIVKKELQPMPQLIRETAANKELLQRYRTYDRSLPGYLLNFSFEGNDAATISHKSIITDILNDVCPIIYKLKLDYRRPRPFQLAVLHNIQLYPMASLAAQCPAWPSMHSTVGHVVDGVCGNKFPESYKFYKDLAKDIGQSRVCLGVCLPSDVEAGQRLADRILENKEFKVKYGL